MDKLKQINWKLPKYRLPLILYIPLLLLGYAIIDLFNTEVADIPDKNLTTTDYLNPELPDARMKGDGIGSKYESMVKSYGKIDDFTAMENIERNNEEDKESYESKYSEEELEQMGLLEAQKLAELQKQLEESAQKGQEISLGLNEEDRISRSQQREMEAMEELNRALAQARLQGQQASQTASPSSNEDNTDNSSNNQELTERKTDFKERVVKGVDEEDEAQEVVKKVKITSDYFNTITENEQESKLIKAIIDENIKAVDGSRVRLRLLDDIEINEIIVPKGSYIYAQMTGFGSQRVKGNIKSILVNDDIIRVNLQLYDTDGLEGLYVPSSSFRETTKDVASGAMNNTSSLTNNSSSAGNSFRQWSNQAITNAIQKTSNALGKSFKKNSAKLKYGTCVYLVNGKEKKNN